MDRSVRVGMGVLAPAPVCCTFIAGFMFVADPTVYDSLPLFIMIGSILGIPITLLPALLYSAAMEFLGCRPASLRVFLGASTLMGTAVGALLSANLASEVVLIHLLSLSGALTGLSVGIMLWALREPPRSSAVGRPPS